MDSLRGVGHGWLTMETASDRRFDPNVAAQLLLDIAHEQSVERVLQKFLRRAVERPDIVCMQVWLIGEGDVCSGCPHRLRCPDRSRCWHLVAGQCRPLGDEGADGLRFDDPGGRIPMGLGLLGSVAATGEDRLVEDMDGEAADIVGVDLLRRHGVCGCGAVPIVYKNELLGAIIGFVRGDMPGHSRSWGRVFANQIGAAIANARAFEEIQRLKAQVELQNSYLQEEVVEAKAFGDLIGRSAALRQVVSQIDLVAPTDASVLILGETGTGKDLVAHEIHRRSGRREGPMIRVNCASIPKDLFESEFFGHVQGAFTGAIKDRAGRFETAERGTIFLDEIGEIPLEMQGKLLRVLHEKRYERVGEDRTRHSDVRVIGATNRDLKKAVAAGRFREDLYYRLHVFPIHVAPLRERRDDIPLLAEHFVELSVKELRCLRPRLTRAGVARLEAYDWPGNVRELRNVIERAVILARGGPLQFDLPVADPAPTLGAPKARSGHANSPGFLTEAEMENLERENLLAVLGRASWKIKGRDGAAELLGIKPTTLLSRMKKMGLARP